MGIQIIVDSCCDTTPERRNRIGMLFAPLKVQVADGPQYTDTPALDTRKLLRESLQTGGGLGLPVGGGIRRADAAVRRLHRCDPVGQAQRVL